MLSFLIQTPMRGTVGSQGMFNCVRNCWEVFQSRTRFKEHLKGNAALASKKERFLGQGLHGAGNPKKSE